MSYDVAVVGSGAAGAALAGRLVEGGAKVLLLERGERAEKTPDALAAMGRYYAAAGYQSALGNCLLPLPTGRALGGTTVINSGTCYRTPPALLRAWEARSGGRFDAAAFEGALDRAWSAVGAKPAPEGTMSRCSALVLEGARRLGLPGGRRLDRAERGCVGSGRCCFVCPSGGKQSADRAFLAPVEGRPGLDLRTGARLTGLSRNGALTLDVDERGRRASFRARRVVLAAGALATPGLVRRHRLGPRWRLAGDGLSVHPATKLFARFDDEVRGWEGVPQGAGFPDPEDPALMYEGVYTPPELAAITLPLEGRRLKEWMDGYARVATFGMMVKDRNLGSVRHPFGPDLPWIRYRLGEPERRSLLRGIKTLARVFLAAGAREVALPVSVPGNTVRSEAELDAVPDGVPASNLSLMGFHPLGTCAAGRVADWDLELEPGVYACDGSSVPEALGVNPQVTIMAFALRLADRLLERT